MTEPLKCWICGQEGTTGEHLIKASDLRSLFGEANNKSPLYFHTNAVKNRLVQGVKAEILKSPARICPQCNNTRTQPNDRAWDQFSKFLRSCNPPISPGKTIHPKVIFKDEVTSQMLNVHLFLIKLFGCKICAHEVPIDIAGFSRALMAQEPHSNIYIKFGCASWAEDQKSAGNSEINGLVDDKTGVCIGAGWFYHVGNLAALVMYARDGIELQGMKNSWHPKYGKNWFLLDKFDAK